MGIRDKVNTRILAWCSVYVVAPNKYTTTPPPKPANDTFAAAIISDDFAVRFVIGVLAMFFGFILLMYALDFWLDWI